MNSIATQLSHSARDFLDVVWPRISQVPLLGGGEVRAVEAVASNDFKDELDFLAGIDAWQVHYKPTSMRGIASRVQWGGCHDSFTIRTGVPSGQETEFQKRLRAIQNEGEGHLYPHLTVQAYLSQRQGTLIAAAAVRTRDLIERAAILVESREKLRPMDDLYGFRTNADGTEFLYMRWKYLLYMGVLQQDNIVAPTS